MFRLSYDSEYKGTVETLQFETHPLRWRMGPFGIHTSKDGRKWHCRGWMNGYLLAAEAEQVDEYWTSTSDNIKGGLHSQTWKPYKVVL